MMTMTQMMTTMTSAAEDDMKSLYASLTSITDRITSAVQRCAGRSVCHRYVDSAQSQI